MACVSVMTLVDTDVYNIGMCIVDESDELATCFLTELRDLKLLLMVKTVVSGSCLVTTAVLFCRFVVGLVISELLFSLFTVSGCYTQGHGNIMGM